MRAAFIVDTLSTTALRPLNYERFNGGAPMSGSDMRPLGELADDVGRSYKRIFTNVDADSTHGIEVLSQSDIYAAEPVGRFIRPDCIPRRELHQIRAGQILIAGAG